MRELLLERIQPLVDRLAADLTSILIDRILAELDGMSEAFEVAVSSYASNTIVHGPSDVLGVGQRAQQPARCPAPFDGPPSTHRDVKPGNYPPSRRSRDQRAALQANGKKPVTCSACGFVGGNARGCGTAHETQLPGSQLPGSASILDTPPIAMPERGVRRLYAKPEALAGRAEVIRARAEHAGESKHEGELPNPRASFLVNDGEVRELRLEEDAK